MPRIAIFDANSVANKEYIGLAGSVVSGWLKWEAERAGIVFSHPSEADIILLVFAGAVDWYEQCRKQLKRAGIEPFARNREGHPYIIAGGPVDAIPLTCLQIADAQAIGEAYTFVRELFSMVTSGAQVEAIRNWIIAYPHAIERSQVENLPRDPARPWLLAEKAPKLASPDQYIDWSMPAIRSDDNVIRVIAEKGCHKKCLFCATTYRQKHQQNTDEATVLEKLSHYSALGERVQLVSNDPMNLKYWPRIRTKLDSQSFTIDEISNDENRRALIQNRIRIARFGVEGLTERIRKAFAKPIPTEKLLKIIGELHANRINTHMFFIAGAPYESKQDWKDFKDFFWEVAKLVDYGVCRMKFTTFLSDPPAPLARFVVGPEHHEYAKEFWDWQHKNAASRHILYITGRSGKSQVTNIAEQISVSYDLADKLYNGGGMDLAPALEDAYRLPWEVVQWPIETETRWKIASTYRERMLAGEPVPAT
jgi:radical SAM superfamily enzyme YgiQ (UPF0313 family)